MAWKLMNNLKFYTRNIASAALAGFVIGMAYVMVLSTNWEDNLIRYGTYGITILVSLFASAIAVGGVLLNLNKQQELIERRHIAARAVLPITLSRLHKLAEYGFETVLDVPALREGNPEVAIKHLKELQISSEDLTQIRECIEAADSETQAWLSLILAHWQIQESRLETDLLDNNIIPKDERQLASAGVDWLIIRAMISHLYDYARTGSSPSHTLESKELRIPLRIPKFDQSELAGAQTRYKEFIEKNGGWSIDGFRERLKSP